MGIDTGLDKLRRQQEKQREQLAALREQLTAMGIDSADVEFQHTATGLLPVVKSVRLGTSAAIASVANADPKNIQEVAASQLEISNDYYQSVLTQARRSFSAAITAGIAGLAFFLTAIAFILYRGNISGALVTTLSGAIVEVIAGLNFWLYGKTARQLDAFHVRLEQTQRFLLANSVCHNLEGETKNSTRSELVRLIAGTVPAPPTEPADE